MRGSDIDTDIRDAAVHRATRHWGERRPALDHSCGACDQSAVRQMPRVPLLPRRGLRLEGRIARRDPLQIDTAHLVPVRVLHHLYLKTHADDPAFPERPCPEKILALPTNMP